MLLLSWLRHVGGNLADSTRYAANPIWMHRNVRDGARRGWVRRWPEAMSDEREVLTWELFGTAARELAVQVADSGYRPDLIFAIARGGLFVAGALGYALDVKNLHVANVEFYTGVDERLPLPIMLPPVPDLVDMAGARVLVADDVADTGATLELVRDFCAGGWARCAARCSTRSRAAGAVRVRLAAHGPVDQLPVVDGAAGGGAPRRRPRRLTG